MGRYWVPTPWAGPGTGYWEEDNNPANNTTTIIAAPTPEQSKQVLDALKTGRSTYDVARSQGRVTVQPVKTKSGTEFKPDYTKANPYEGAPADYIAKVNRSFVPTVNNPLPPYAGRVVNSNRQIILDAAGNRRKVKSEKNAESLDDEVSQAKIKKRKEIIQRDNVELPDGNLVNREEYDNLSDSYKEIAQIRGLDALNQAIEYDRKQFLDSNVKLADDTYISRESFDKLPEKYQKVLINDGLEALNRQINTDEWEAWGERTEAESSSAKELNDAFKALQPYAEYGAEIWPAGTTEEQKQKERESVLPKGYDVAKYLREHPNDIKTLRSAGISEEDIQSAREYNRLTRGIDAPDYVDSQTYIKQYFKDKGWEWGSDSKVSGKEYEKRQKEAQKAHDNLYRPVISEDQFVRNQLEDQYIDYDKLQKELNNLNEPYPAKIKTEGAKLLEAKALYRRKYGVGAEVKTVLADFGSLAFAPARALRPEVSIKDISGMEWTIGGAQLALIASPFTGKLMSTGLQTGSTAIFGIQQVKDWGKMTANQRVASIIMDAGILIPTVKSLVDNVHVSTVKVPSPNGDIEIWRGFDISGRPIVGLSKGKLTVGSTGVTYPNVKDIAVNYKPITILETKLLTNSKALSKMGFDETEIAKIQQTLKNTRSFEGKQSPYAPKTITPDEVKSLNKVSVDTLFKDATKNPDVEMIYGSSTIKAQLAPELKNWRKPADIDVQLSTNTDGAVKYTRQLADKLKLTEGSNNVRISKDSPTLIETKRDGEWHHAVDIHAKEEIPGTVASVDQAAGYGWVDDLAEPALVVNYPDGGTLNIMRLSESGKRKAIAILRWQNKDAYIKLAEKQGKTAAEIQDILDQLNVKGDKSFIAPEPKRMKDISDYYVILRTFKGEKVANAWADTYGFNTNELLKAGLKSPPEIIGWKYSPKAGKVGSKSPSVSVFEPTIVNGSGTPIKGVSDSSSLTRFSSLSPSIVIKGSKSANVSSVNDNSHSLSVINSNKSSSVSIEDKDASLINVNSGSKQSKSIPVGNLITPPNKIGLHPETYSPVVVPHPEKPSPFIRPPNIKPPDIKPPEISPPNIRPPIIPPFIKPPDKTPGKLPGLETKAPKEQHTAKEYATAVTWKQGLGYWTVFPDKTIEFSMTKPDGVNLVAGPDRNKPAATIQVRNAKPGARVTTFDADMGIQDVRVRKQSGKILNIRFKQDRKQRTTNRVNLKLHSEKRGKVYYTRVGKGQIMSKRPL